MKALLALLLLLFLGIKKVPSEKKQPNILFIAVDDLRPELGCYGNELIKTPNIDKLAEDGHLFKNHFVSVPTCGASRQALLTGFHPRSTQHLSNHASEIFISGKPETDQPETLIHHLRRNGYHTVGIGKISHNPEGKIYGYEEPNEGTLRELPHSWSELIFNSGKWGTAHNAFFGYADGTNRNTLKKQVKPYEMADVPDEGYVDGLTANLAIDKIQELSKKKQPFMLAVGFFKPHLPFNAPKKYWDLYDRNDIPTAPFKTVPENTSTMSLHGSGEFNQYQLGEEKVTLEEPVSEAYAQKLRHAYYACVSYTDAQVGKLISQLKKEGIYENTIIVLWGDHGWHLGDHNIWGKHTCFDRALRSPLIIKTTEKRNSRINEVVSSVDIYPTLIALANLKMPHKTDGESLLPLMKGEKSGWKNRAFSYYNNRISVRTPRYRITKYLEKEENAVDLYDLKNDPNETVNIAEQSQQVIKRLYPLLKEADNGLLNK
jgi:arylsulfatase A-like enzyme